MTLTELMAALLFAVAAAVGGYFFGHHQAGVACTAANLAPLQAAVEHHSVAQAAGTLSDGQSATRAAQTAAVFSRINLEAFDYVQTHPLLPSPLPQGAREPSAPDATCVLDADGLRLWASANAGTWFDSTAASLGHASLPSFTRTRERPDERPLDQSPSDRQGVSRVSGSASSVDRPLGSDGQIKP